MATCCIVFVGIVNGSFWDNLGPNAIEYYWWKSQHTLNDFREWHILNGWKSCPRKQWLFKEMINWTQYPDIYCRCNNYMDHFIHIYLCKRAGCLHKFLFGRWYVYLLSQCQYSNNTHTRIQDNIWQFPVRAPSSTNEFCRHSNLSSSVIGCVEDAAKPGNYLIYDKNE